MPGPAQPFLPGNNANPGGRPKMPPELKTKLRELTPAVIDRLVELMKDSKGTVAVRACEVLLDRAWGKPVQALSDPDGNPIAPLFDLSRLGVEDLRALVGIAQRSSIAAAAGEPGEG